MAIHITNELPLDVWSEYVRNHPDGNVFHTPEMHRVFEQAANHTPRLWAAVEEGRPLALLTPVELAQFSGPLRRLTARGVAYGSVLAENNERGSQVLGLLLSAYRADARRRLVFSELRNLSDLSRVQSVLEEERFTFNPHFNYLISLEVPTQNMLEKIGKRTRKHIRRGLRRGDVEITLVNSKEQISTCYDLLSRTYKAAQIPLADRSLFEAAYDILSPQDMIQFSLAYVEEIPAAVSVELLFKDVIYGWYGGMDRRFSSCVPNEMLMWRILEESAERGFKTYDFGGAGSPDQEYGVRDFKAKFGGELVSFGRFTCVHSKISFALSRLGYKIYRRF